MSLFLPITKVDAVQRLVYGTISEETPDKTGEILDYATAKPAFLEWSQQFHAASGGKSYGNVRAMHTSVAAGKLTDIYFDDENKRIDGVAKIVDDDEWSKVLEGVYTGFSIGGGYARRWPDAQNPALMRYTPVLSEVSLVDNPAVPTATFQLIKKDGSVELRKFDVAPAGQAESLLKGLSWLAAHAQAIGAAGLLRHINAVEAYLKEMDESDATNMAAAKAMSGGEVNKLKGEINMLQKRIVQLEAQPLPAKGMLRAIGKTEDHPAKREALLPLSKNAQVHELMKAALANPMPF